MSNTSSSGAIPIAAHPWAEVLVHNRIIRYRRTGAGATIVLMLPEPDVAPLSNALVRALSDGYRLIVPELPPRDSRLECVAEFLDGLGASGVTLVAASPFCIAAIELALRDPDQIARLVLIPDGEATDGVIADSIVATFGETDVAALIIRPELDAERAAAVIAGFIGVLESKAG